MSRKTQNSQYIDRAVGTCIRHYRLKKELSQNDLAHALDISYQQLHKYETGNNSVSASRLADIAKALKIRETDLFSGLYEENSDAPEDDSGDTASLGREQLMLIHYLERIQEPEKRQALRELLQSLALSAC